MCDSRLLYLSGGICFVGLHRFACLPKMMRTDIHTCTGAAAAARVSRASTASSIPHEYLHHPSDPFTAFQGQPTQNRFRNALARANSSQTAADRGAQDSRGQNRYMCIRKRWSLSLGLYESIINLSSHLLQQSMSILVLCPHASRLLLFLLLDPVLELLDHTRLPLDALARLVLVRPRHRARRQQVVKVRKHRHDRRRGQILSSVLGRWTARQSATAQSGASVDCPTLPIGEAVPRRVLERLYRVSVRGYRGRQGPARVFVAVRPLLSGIAALSSRRARLCIWRFDKHKVAGFRQRRLLLESHRVRGLLGRRRPSGRVGMGRSAKDAQTAVWR